MSDSARLSHPTNISRDQRALLERRLRGESAAEGSTLTIPLRSNQGAAPLSLAQEGQWLLQQLFPDNAALNTFRTWRSAKPFERSALEAALTEVVRRHEILRTNFRIIDASPMQVIRPPEPATVGVIDLSDLPSADRKAELVRWLRKRTAEPFDLAEDELFRCDLVRMTERDHIVLFNLHHIICDGWSLGVLMRETTALYKAISKGKPYPLTQLPLQYGDYAAWQRSSLQGEVLERQLSFWRARLANAPPTTALPFDRPRPPERSFRGAQSAVALPRSLVARLRALCRKEQTTLFMAMIGALATLFHRYSGATDIVIGSPVANRSLAEVEPLIGLFMNTVAFRFDLSGDPPFKEFLGRVRAEAMEVFNNQDLAFESVVTDLGVRREKNRSPVFQTMLVMQPPRTGSAFAELGVDAAELAPRGSKFDFTLTLSEGEGGDVGGVIEYDTDLFEQATIDRLSGHFVALLEGIAADPRRRLSALPMLGRDERRQAIGGWSATAAPYPQACLHELFAGQAARTPDAVALRFSGRRLDYRTLEKRANQLAWRLRGLGVGPDTIVGLCMRRSPEQVIALLGILKAGGAYLPLDPGYPPDRLAYMIADAQPRVFVTEAALAALLPARQAPVVELDSEWFLIDSQPAAAPPVATSPDNLAYLLYTSGSTGRPKGVMGTHRAIVNRLHWDPPRPSGDEVYVQKTTLGFIDSLWEIFMPLIRGQSTVIVPEEVACDPSRFVDLLEREGATRLVLVPSFLRSVLDSPRHLARLLSKLRHWACSGEALSAPLAAAFAARLPEAELFNIYGASEFWDATWFAARDRDGRSGVRIGSPIANMRAIVLDADFEPMPINVAGELFIGGVGLARGYLGQPGLTAERFLPDPLGDGERIYRTGDMARRGSDGVLEFVGRRDHQVKLRGHRIELSEIERALQDHPGVRHAVVERRDDLPSGEPGLVAYLAPEGAAPTDSALREHLKASLPSHMTPAYFVVLTELPLTPSGKVDRAALPPPQPRQQPSRIHIAPKSEMEKLLAGIWSEILGVEDIGVDDSFFELGGGSLTLVRVQSMIGERARRDIPIVVLFRYPTIRALSSYLVEGHRNDILVGSTKRGEARKKFLTRRAGLEARPGERGILGTD
jgi:amino acid adenylation domain-containing protein